MTPDELIEAARQETGLADAGDPGFLEPLAVLLESIGREGHLGDAGREGLRQDVVRHLVNRLRLVRDLAEHPEIRDEVIDDPIVVVGLPRTGTTKLQRMIAADPGVHSLPLWQALYPAPWPDPDPRRDVAAAFVQIMTEQAPDFADAHPMGPAEADEEMFLQLGAFDGPASWGMFYRAPSYVEWLRGRPRERSYDYLKTMLRYLQWQAGGKAGKPWVLKTPLHLGHLDVLAKTFPDATVVHCHRDIEVGMASLCRLIEVARKARGCEHVDPEELGPYLLDFWADEWTSNLQQRADLPESVTVLDVPFTRIAADPVEVIQEIYAHHGRTLTPDATDNMLAWEAAHTADAGRHRYELADYGITGDDIREAFAGYLQMIGAGA